VPQTALAQKLGIPVQRINEIGNGKRGITPEAAWLSSGAFNTTPEFWTNLQAAHDLARARPRKRAARIAR
jgi:addiction module HigA family antidote